MTNSDTPDHDDAVQALLAAATHALRFRAELDAGCQAPGRDYANEVTAFDRPLPESGRPAVEVIEDLVRTAGPGLHAMAGRRFFGWVIGHSHPVGVAADWLTAAWGQNAGNPVVSPAAAACETVAARWLLELLGLPASCSVGFVTGGTMANFVGLAAARSEVLRRVGWDVEAHGLLGAPPIEVLVGEEAHASVHLGLQYLGLGSQRAQRIAVDEQGRMLPDALERALRDTAGRPLLVVLQAGQLNTGAFDDFGRLIPLAHRAGAWVHVDGAFGLWARATPALAHRTAGVEAADSWATDGHKWLQTPYDCGYAIVRDAQAHARAMRMQASYLPQTEGERDPSHYVPELSRRARGFATWALIAHLGRQGIAQMVEHHAELARRMAARLGSEPEIAILNEVVLNQVVVRFGAGRTDEEGDRLTQATIAQVQADGVCYLGGAVWRGRWVMRISVIGGATQEHDIDRSAEAIVRAWQAVAARAEDFRSPRR